MFTTLVGAMSLGEEDLKTRQTTGSCCNQFYSEHRTVCTLSVNESNLS